jgi:hypothetical protein
MLPAVILRTFFFKGQTGLRPVFQQTQTARRERNVRTHGELLR